MIYIIENVLKGKLYLSNIEKVSGKEYNFDFILRNGDVIPLIMHINSKRFPFELPNIYINNKKQSYIPNIPHVTSNGYICYLDKEGVVWSDDIVKTFDYIFHRVESIFFEEDNEEGIQREFQYYFSQIKDIEYMFSCISEGDIVKKVKLYIDNKTDIKFAFDDNETTNLNEVEKPQVVNAIYIPFYKILDIYVPNKYKFWSNEEINKLIYRCVSEENIAVLRKISKPSRQSYYILNILLVDGQTVFIGLRYDNKSYNYKDVTKIPIILDENNDVEIKPIYIERLDDKKSLVRGGAITNGDDFSILVIGCGSVGSDVTFQLARSGFKNISIVDYDKFSQDNIYRHFLGKSRNKANKNKSILMKEELMNRYDNMQINAYQDDIFNLLEKRELDLKNYSLIISAIGDVNKERLLNKYIIDCETPVIYTWVEAFGLGGHAVLTNNGDKGCFNCLITEQLRCKVNFAGNSDKPFVKNFGGCLGTFTPYGSMDSMQTAIIATRLSQDCLVNLTKGNKVLSWKGNHELFEKNGYTVDETYENFNNVTGLRDDIKFDGCEYCNDYH